MRIHFIAIGGAVMHNLAIALKKEGHRVRGSDDEILDPSRSRLTKHGLLPEKAGWFPDRITPELDAVILGMHARGDNPELERARKLNLKIFSFPEFLYERTRNKTRVVIGGSHGKTTITAMIMHVLRVAGHRFDYMAGSRVEGFETMVGFDQVASVAVFEGDEYLTSPLDPRPKFHLYHPRIAVISGIAWDHMNVFPSRENYLDQFRKFIRLIEKDGILFFDENDPVIRELIRDIQPEIRMVPYPAHPYRVEKEQFILLGDQEEIPVQVFGRHNMQNLNAARMVCRELGLGEPDFYRAIATFHGAGRRLEMIHDRNGIRVFKDFAHAPSKVRASIGAVKERNPEIPVIACLELHTFSSLNKEFLPQYRGSMDKADRKIVYFNPQTVEKKQLPALSTAEVKTSFGRDIQIFTNLDSLKVALKNRLKDPVNYLFMSSGHFDGLDLLNILNP